MKQQYVIWFIMLIAAIYVSISYLFILFFHKNYFEKEKYLIKKSWQMIWKLRKQYLYSLIVIVLTIGGYYFTLNYLVFIVGVALITTLNQMAKV